jgi:hypothetical protein
MEDTDPLKAAAVAALNHAASIIKEMLALDDPASRSFGSELTKLRLAVDEIGDARAAALN